MNCIECKKVTPIESFNYNINDGSCIHVCNICVCNILKKLLPYNISKLKIKKKIILRNLNRKYNNNNIKITV